MTDRFAPISMQQLTDWIFDELEQRGSIFGVPRDLFFVPQVGAPYEVSVYGQRLDTPFGVAAGPHSQMAQNIVVAWLLGARFIELKTVQTLDDLEISKPCIDMEDEGYNVEWSQELKTTESFDEYLRAWVLIHALHAHLGFPGDGPGVIFNISVGYDLQGIKQPNVQRFLSNMRDATEGVAACKATVSAKLGGLDFEVPHALSDNVTLSTMHGCPPEEIELIASYLLADLGFHTSVKLNPTLLGPAVARRILNEDLGYADVWIPDEAFGHDLKWAAAEPMLRRLLALAGELELTFGVKLTNTLEVQNHRTAFSADNGMMYMSGRPLHALSTTLAAKISEAFDGALLMSFAGGADAFNVEHLLAAGMKTVTVCTDLLKTGGYLRLPQYLSKTAAALRDAHSIDEYVLRLAGEADDLPRARVINARRYASQVLTEPLLHKDRFDTSESKSDRVLHRFDCVMAPCTDNCGVNQDVPAYMRAVAEGRFDDAVDIVRDRNPIGATLSHICDRRCQDTCIRTHIDEPLAIREMKRFIMAQELVGIGVPERPTPDLAPVAIIGAGPLGLAAAETLVALGHPCTIFEQNEKPGGIVAATIPTYRLPQAIIDQDVAALEARGVTVQYGQRAGRDFSLRDLRERGFVHVVLGVGAQVSRRLGVPGEDAPGVLHAVDYLRAVRAGASPAIGPRVGVVGAGDVSMDSARTAYRMADGQVSLIYRRTLKQSPADPEEIEGLVDEGVAIRELRQPVEVLTDASGRLRALRCEVMELGPRGDDGRRRPQGTGAFEDIELDTLIVAISQNAVLDFVSGEEPEQTRQGFLKVDRTTGATSVAGLYAGGDAAGAGPSSAVQAAGDGQRIARFIHALETGETAPEPELRAVDRVERLRQLGQRELGQTIPHRDIGDRKNFEPVTFTLSQEAAQAEAQRCLSCDEVCSLCVSVCPNLAFFNYQTAPWDLELQRVVVGDDGPVLEDDGPFRVLQEPQVAVFNSFCNECGNCATFCPTAGRPYHDKPRIYTDRGEFNGEQDNAFLRTGTRLEARYAGETHLVERAAGGYRYARPGLEAVLDDDLTPRWFQVSGGAGEYSLRPAAEMVVLLEALVESCSFMP